MDALGPLETVKPGKFTFEDDTDGDFDTMFNDILDSPTPSKGKSQKSKGKQKKTAGSKKSPSDKKGKKKSDPFEDSLNNDFTNVVRKGDNFTSNL